MKANFLSSHQSLSLKQAFITNLSFNRTRNNRLVFKKIVRAKQGENDDANGSPSVDENMVVLRMRIKNIKALETASKEGEDDQWASSGDWKEWEKKTFKTYQQNVCETMEMMQSYLLKTRPSVTMGMLALVAMAVPLSSSAVTVNMLKLVKGLLAGCHVCIDIEF